MHWRNSLILVLQTLVFCSAPYTHASERLRVALLEFQGDENRLVTTALAKSLAEDTRIALVDLRQAAAAANGFGYDGSLNLTVEDARRLGAAIGCEFYILGKTFTTLRRSVEKTTYGESLIAIFIVDARAGRLVKFDHALTKGETPQSAQDESLSAIKNRIPEYISNMSSQRAEQLSLLQQAEAEPIEEMPEEGSPQAAGFKPPQTFRRYIPEITELARLAEVTATVELAVVFHSDGRIGKIDVLRWAGFGLDESAIKTAREIKFKPATRNNLPISVRAVLQYRFKFLTEIPTIKNKKLLESRSN